MQARTHRTTTSTVRRLVCRCALVLAYGIAFFLALTTLAHAEGTLTLEGSGLTYSVHRVDDASDPANEPAVARCYVACTMKLPLGKYLVRAEAADLPTTDTLVRLRHPALPVSVRGAAGSPSARTIGAVLGYGGLAVAGLALVVGLIESSPFSEYRDDRPHQRDLDRIVRAMEVVGAIGAVTAIIGFVVRASNGTSLQVDESSHGTTSFVVVPIPSGAVVALGGIF